MTAAAVAAPRHARRRRRWALGIAAIAALGLLSLGCTSTITPPREPAHPTTVYLLREAMHSGLVLPPSPGSPDYVEYGFGDWGWFALGHDAWYHVFATVLWPTAGALARRTFAAANDSELRARVTWAELQALTVDGDLVARLRAELQQRFEAGLAHAVRRADLGWTFVPMDRGYWFGNTCADVAAEWFVALGCEVSWVPIRASLTTGTGS